MSKYYPLLSILFAWAGPLLRRIWVEEGLYRLFLMLVGLRGPYLSLFLTLLDLLVGSCSCFLACFCFFRACFSFVEFSFRLFLSRFFFRELFFVFLFLRLFLSCTFVSSCLLLFLLFRSFFVSFCLRCLLFDSLFVSLFRSLCTIVFFWFNFIYYILLRSFV